jgi:hypothetical protein
MADDKIPSDGTHKQKKTIRWLKANSIHMHQMLASGGEAGTKSPDFSGNLSVTYDPNTGGADVNGNLYPPGSPILNDPRIRRLISESAAAVDDGSSDTPSGIAKSHKDGPFGTMEH